MNERPNERRPNERRRADSGLRHRLNALLDEEARIEQDAASPSIVAAELAAILGLDDPSQDRLSGTSYTIRVARPDEIDLILGLIDDAAQWLRAQKNTSQWARPWPNPDARRQRVQESLLGQETWLLFDMERPIGTVTIKLIGSEELWTPEERTTEAVYLHDLVIDRAYSGRGLGAKVIDWAGRKGASVLPAVSLIRIDVWTDNAELQNYFRSQGFNHVGMRTTGDDTPSGALLEKPLT